MSQTIRIISWNVAGVRAVERKGDLQQLLDNFDPDILFLQETKALPEQLSLFLTAHEDYYQHYNPAEKKGYSGTGVWAKKKLFNQEPKITTGMPGWEDSEGRVIRLDSDKRTYIGIYFPNGGKSKEAWNEKIEFYEHFLKYVNRLRGQGRKIIWTGDLNVAHHEIDLARPKQNRKSIGFLPEERAWVDKLIAKGWVDVWRKAHSEEVSYTYWDLVSRARDRNVGWRIDYFFVDESEEKLVGETSHLHNIMGSDHCPILLEMKLKQA